LLDNLNLYSQLDLNITATDNAPINNALNELLPRLAISNTNQRIAKHHLKIILLNLYKNYYTNRKMFTGFHQNKIDIELKADTIRIKYHTRLPRL